MTDGEQRYGMSTSKKSKSNPNFGTARGWAVSIWITRQAQSARIGLDTIDGTQSLGEEGCRTRKLDDFLFQEKDGCCVERDDDRRWNEKMVERNEGDTSQPEGNNNASKVQNRQDKPNDIKLSLNSQVECDKGSILGLEQ